MGLETAGLIGLGLGVGGIARGVGGFLGARGQAQTAEELAAQQERIGREVASGLGEAGAAAQQSLRSGAAGAQGFLERGLGAVAQQQHGLPGLFAGERQLGQNALARLEGFLSGDIGDIGEDAGFQFRQQQGEQAIARAAAAQGAGGGSVLKELARFNQGLASQEAQNQFNRLLQLQQVGSGATRAQAGLSQGLLGQQLGLLGQQAGLQSGLGSALANTQLGTASNIANARTGAAANQSNLALQAANARAQGLGQLGGSIGQLALLAALIPGLSGAGGSAIGDGGIIQ